jgi:hypothetical protein
MGNNERSGPDREKPSFRGRGGFRGADNHMGGHRGGRGGMDQHSMRGGGK